MKLKPKTEKEIDGIYKVLIHILKAPGINYRDPYIFTWVGRKAFGRKHKQEPLKLLKSWHENADVTETKKPPFYPIIIE